MATPVSIMFNKELSYSKWYIITLRRDDNSEGRSVNLM